MLVPTVVQPYVDIKRGNKSTFTCPFHGWSFNNTGKLLKAKDEKTGGYQFPNVKEDGSHDLKKLAAL